MNEIIFCFFFGQKSSYLKASIENHSWENIIYRYFFKKANIIAEEDNQNADLSEIGRNHNNILSTRLVKGFKIHCFRFQVSSNNYKMYIENF